MVFFKMYADVDSKKPYIELLIDSNELEPRKIADKLAFVVMYFVKSQDNLSAHVRRQFKSHDFLYQLLKSDLELCALEPQMTFFNNGIEGFKIALRAEG